ncbi:ribonuclease J [Sphingomonas sp. G124]|jgi:ribonuclease J|uniref:Ribonuclease J n=1 Tax=Sphingomonas cremea TaxID=2904799 RepID=A0A9X1TXL3_9SPHN|nr:ribonuclease J [Sphingomonas cremea]MCF2513952.1 ribonuclease J [Sphingomonas cremea]
MTPGEELLFLALGGSGEIGMNVNLYGCRGKWLMADLGLTFADSDYPGVDLILPDLEFIEQRMDDLVGIVLTHGHEDHIGALPYLADNLKVPLYATPFTAGLIAGKLEEEGLTGQVSLRVIERGGSIDLDPFKVTYVPLAHSIPEGNGLLIETPFGNIFHTGDWKIDETPVLGLPSSAETMTAIGDRGVLALVCDSTNTFQDAASGSEAGVHAGLLDAVIQARGRVVITTFASNAARLETIGRVALETGRRVCVAGRSLDRILKVAKATGYLRDFPEPVRFDEAMRLPREELLVIATGGQGEPRAALGRIAFGMHELKLSEGDTVIFSSKQIPGNEIPIGRIMNALSDLGALIVTDRQAHVHVSGHPGRPELAAMYRWIRPEILVPVHGEIRHMREQARLGLSQGIPSAMVQRNGDLIRLTPDGPQKIGEERTGRLVLDGDVILPADGATLNERRKIAINGLITVALPVDGERRQVGKALIRPFGVPVEEDRDDFLADAADAAERAYEPTQDLEKVREAVRLAVRRCATLWTGKKPVVEVMLVEANP